MALSSITVLSIVELVIYILLLPLILYLAWRHRLPGLLGSAYLFIFATLRLVSDGIQISHASGNSTTGGIVNSVGLSPLLLAVAGVIHESEYHLNDSRRTKKQKTTSLLLQIGLHVVAIGGIALAAAGGANLASATTYSQRKRDHVLQYVGSIILLLVWVALVLHAWLVSRKATRQRASSNAKTLVTAAVVALPFVGVRTVYGVVYAFDHSRSINPVTGTFAIKLVLIFLVQLIAVISLVAGLLVTRHMADERRQSSIQGETGMEDVQHATK